MGFSIPKQLRNVGKVLFELQYRYVRWVAFFGSFAAEIFALHVGISPVVTDSGNRTDFSETALLPESDEIGVDLEDYAHTNVNEVYASDELFIEAGSGGAIMPSPLNDLEKQRIRHELRRLGNAFNNIEALFTRTVLKVQKIDKDDGLGPETITNLKSFLEGTHDLTAIVEMLWRAVGIKFNEGRIRALTKEMSPSLSHVVRMLRKHTAISDKDARQILLNNSLLAGKELLHLIENGVAKTLSGYFLQLRTGEKYGDVLGLMNKILFVTNKFNKKDELRYCKKSVTDLLCEIPMPELVDAFLKEGLDPEKTIADAWTIQELQKHFLFVGSLLVHTTFRPAQVGFNPTPPGTAAGVDNGTYTVLQFVPLSLAPLLLSNYYLSPIDASLGNAFIAMPLALVYFGALNFLNQRAEWWMLFTDGFLGGGIEYTVNFNQGTFWSHNQPTFLQFGLIGAGWRDTLTAGITVQTMLQNNVFLGTYAYLSVTKSHDVIYKGQYPIDGKFASIRGLSKIEIVDNMGKSGQGIVTLDFGALPVPVGAAFKASISHTTQRTYRTHEDLNTTSRMLKDSNFPGVLFLLGKKIKEKGIPQFDQPENLKEGDELLETKIGKLSGAFLFGLDSTVQLAAMRIGGSIELTAEFALGLKRLPGNKFEVSIEPKRIFELGFFAGAFNIMGVAHIKNLAIARKQIFFFDFDQPEAKAAYFDLVMEGRLPIGDEIKVYHGDGGPEYLLAEFRAQNEALKLRGIGRVFLETMYINSSETFYGFSSPLASALFKVINRIERETVKSRDRANLRLDGIDRAFFQSNAESVATNGLVAVRRSTTGGRRSIGRGLYGRYNEDLFVTHRRLHTIDESDANFVGNKWQFDSLVVHAQIEDTMVTNDDDNKLAAKINRLFGTFIGQFQLEHTKAPRKISMEREISKNDIAELTHQECFGRIPVTSEITGIGRAKLYEFLSDIKNKHIDLQGHLVKKFIEDNKDLIGFAAIHQLLGAKPERLHILTERGYANSVLQAKKFIAKYSNISEETGTVKVKLKPVKSDRKVINEFFATAKYHMREIDRQLRILADDQYLLDDKSRLISIFGKERVKLLINAGIRQDKKKTQAALVAVRKNLLDLLDLNAQGFSDDQRMIIYDLAKKRHLPLEVRALLLLRAYENQVIAVHMSKDYLRMRLRKCWCLISEMSLEIENLQKDEVMNTMDKDYVNNTVAKLKNLRSRLLTSASLSHLSSQEVRVIKSMFGEDKHKRSRTLRKKLEDALVKGALINFSTSQEDQMAL